MAKVSGKVEIVHTYQEDRDVVLRFKFRSDMGDLIPVEMRGHRLCGLLDPDDQVMMNCKRDKYGIMHPKVVTNLSTDSVVRMEGPGWFRAVIKFVFSTAVSIATGVFTSIIISSFTKTSKTAPRLYSMPHSGSPAGPAMEPAALVLAVVVGLLVFYLIYIRPRRR
jgi:hypothetical protein